MAETEEPARTISELAKAAGVNVETIRYYERIGLLRQPRKPARGWRRYEHEALRRIRFVKRAQELGFTLAEVEELLGLRGSCSARTCRRVATKARGKVDEIDAKVRDLLAMKQVLVELAATCPEDGAGEACPILDALDGE